MYVNRSWDITRAEINIARNDRRSLSPGNGIWFNLGQWDWLARIILHVKLYAAFSWRLLIASNWIRYKSFGIVTIPIRSTYVIISKYKMLHARKSIYVQRVLDNGTEHNLTASYVHWSCHNGGGRWKGTRIDIHRPLNYHPSPLRTFDTSAGISPRNTLMSRIETTLMHVLHICNIFSTRLASLPASLSILIKVIAT